MQILKAAMAAAVLLSMALAGCSGGAGGAGGFSVKDEGAGTYTFKASGSADNYTWDLGDHLTRAYGKSVTHTYDFDNGVVPVVLVTTKGETRAEHRREITLGTGTNANAGFVLEGSTNWTVPGETVSFSTHRSTDPDGDPLRFTWSCQRTGDALRQGIHTHPGFGGKPFATPPAGSVFSVNAQGPLPAADRTVPGDLCDGLGQSSRPSLDATIAGAFTRTGIYDIYILASDPVHPTTSGKYRIVVTPPAEKPAEQQVLPFEGTFLGGSGGTVQEVCGTVEEQCTQSFDRVLHSFSLPLPGQSGHMTLEYEYPTDAITIDCAMSRGTTPIATASGPSNVTLPAGNLKAAAYAIVCQPSAIAPTSAEGVSYKLTVFVDLDLDPFLIY